MDLAAESAFNPASSDATRAPSPEPTSHDEQASAAHASSSRAPVVDPSEVGSSSTSQPIGPNTASTGTATLEQEVGQVVHQLSSWGGSLWGGFRKQSAFAFESVKKDLSRTVQEAQEDLKKLQTQTVELGLKDLSATDSTIVKGKGKETGESHLDSGATSAPNTVLPNTHVPSTQDTKDFFAKIGETFSLQSHTINASINQNLSTLQKSLSDSLASASVNPQIQSLNLNKLSRSDINFAQFSSNIQKNLAQAGTKLNIQQAEKIAEEYIRNAGEFLKDAVKVVPPDEHAEQGVAWDGSDMYSFSTAGQSAKEAVPYDITRYGTTEVSRSQLRKEALLRRLRADKDLFLVDPAAETESSLRRAAFKAFYQTEIEGKGGADSQAFEEMIQSELNKEGADVESLKSTRDALGTNSAFIARFSYTKGSLAPTVLSVPSQLTQQVFWTRYFFHKYAIEDEERKRQELLQATLEPQAEDFSWDEEDEKDDSPVSAETLHPAVKDANPRNLNPEHSGSVSASTSTEPATAVQAQSSPSVQSIGITDSSNTSARVSEESYVAIKDQKPKQAAGPRVEIGKDAGQAVNRPAVDDDEEDSDWE